MNDGLAGRPRGPSGRGRPAGAPGGAPAVMAPAVRGRSGSSRVDLEAAHLADGEVPPEEPVDRPELILLVEGDEGHGEAGHPGSTRPSDAVDVVLGVVGDLEVDDHRQALDVEPASRDVGRHEDPDLSGLERLERPLALGLRPVAVDGRGLDPVSIELRGKSPRSSAWCD